MSNLSHYFKLSCLTLLLSLLACSPQKTNLSEDPYQPIRSKLDLSQAETLRLIPILKDYTEKSAEIVRNGQLAFDKFSKKENPKQEPNKDPETRARYRIEIQNLQKNINAKISELQQAVYPSILHSLEKSNRMAILNLESSQDKGLIIHAIKHMIHTDIAEYENQQ